MNSRGSKRNPKDSMASRKFRLERLCHRKGNKFNDQAFVTFESCMRRLLILS